jgi:hypothetical protein
MSPSAIGIARGIRDLRLDDLFPEARDTGVSREREEEQTCRLEDTERTSRSGGVQSVRGEGSA